MKDNILIIGANGQIGTELTVRLREIYGNDAVIASDVKDLSAEQLKQSGPYETLNILDKVRLLEVIKKHQITQVYLLAALLSATAEKNPSFAWQLNMDGLFNILQLAEEKIIKKIYWPSSIAVFGPTTPRVATPQYTIMEPTTVYGISKQAGERWCEWYFKKYGVDVRSLRYPGLIGYQSAPGGGTTDYAVHIFHEAINKGSYDCFLKEDTILPMMYMPDAIAATVNIMEAPADQIKIRSSYNLAGISFSPKEIAKEINSFIPEFSITYHPDFRQAIADSWPQSINDEHARTDWGWKHAYDLKNMCEDMFKHLQKHKVTLTEKVS